MAAPLLGSLAGYVIGFGSLFAIWHVASVYLLNSVLFPPPRQVVAKAIELARDGTLWENASISLQRIALGFFCGTLIGIPLGLAIGSFGIVRRMLGALHRVSPLHSGNGADHRGGHLVRHRRRLEDLPDHLHHGIHRHHQHRGRRERGGAQQDPRRAIARRQPRTGLPASSRCRQPCPTSSPACASPWATRS